MLSTFFHEALHLPVCSERRKVGSFLWTKEERTNERRRAKLSEEKFFTWKATENIIAKGERRADVPSEYKRESVPARLPY